MNVPRRWLIILGIRGSLSEHRRKSQPSKNTKEDMGGNMSQFFRVKIVILKCSPLSSKQYTYYSHTLENGVMYTSSHNGSWAELAVRTRGVTRRLWVRISHGAHACFSMFIYLLIFQNSHFHTKKAKYCLLFAQDCLLYFPPLLFSLDSIRWQVAQPTTEHCDE